MNDRTKLSTIVAVVATAVVALGAAGLMGCSKKQQTVPDPGPKPSGANFEGVWFSPQFEHMYLRQSGEKVTGVYAYKTGGRIEGRVDGNLLTFKWIDPGDKQKAQRDMNGHGYLKLVREDGELMLKGEWGYDEEYRGAGPWSAQFVRDIESGDPMQIQQIREQGRNPPTP